MTPFVDWLEVSCCTQKERKMSVVIDFVEKQIRLESSHVNKTMILIDSRQSIWSKLQKQWVREMTFYENLTIKVEMIYHYKILCWNFGADCEADGNKVNLVFWWIMKLVN